MPQPNDQPDDDAELAPRPEPSEATSKSIRSFLLKIAYDGSAYCGWQLQPDQPTVQQAVEAALCKVFDLPHVRVHASSRTDTGVHALGQAAVVRTHAWTAPPDRLHVALNTRLPPDIVARASVEVPSSFHPLRDSTGKRYRYQVFSSKLQDPIGARTHWWIRRRVTLEAMRAAAERLEGRHDFDSFQSTGSPRSSTVRTVRSLTVEERPHIDGTLYTIEIEADGFLYNMVRNIVGTLIQVGVGRESPQWVTSVLEARDRTLAGATAPPQGLTLLEVLF